MRGTGMNLWRFIAQGLIKSGSPNRLPTLASLGTQISSSFLHLCVEKQWGKATCNPEDRNPDRRDKAGKRSLQRALVLPRTPVGLCPLLGLPRNYLRPRSWAGFTACGLAPHVKG